MKPFGVGFVSEDKMKSVLVRLAQWAMLGFLAVAISPPPLAAQAISGTILGVVRDGSGAAIPGVTVVLTNSGTGQTRTVVTDSAGEYTAPQLPRAPTRSRPS